MTNFPKYDLSNDAIIDIATMVTGEQGGTDVLACQQEVSQLANLNEVTKHRNNSEEDIIKTLHSGWYASSSWGRGYTNTAIEAVKSVLIEGKRVLPRYVTEHDTFPMDIRDRKDRSEYSMGDPISNIYGSNYRFYTFFGSMKNLDISGYFQDDYEIYKEDIPYGEVDISRAIDKVIELAENEVGYLEKATNSDLYDKTVNAGSNNYTKYWEEIKPSYQGEPWCACFVTWIFVQAFGKEKTEKLLKHYPYVYCPTMKDLFTLNANPKRGDIVIFYRNGEFAHTGLVTEVANTQGDPFYTIEGNTSSGSSIIANGGAVCKKSYNNSNLPGTKFITVDWGLVAETEDILMSKEYDELNEKINILNDKIEASEPMIYNYIDSNMPEWAIPTIQKLVNKGLLKGDENGELGLTDDLIRMYVVNDRAGLYGE